MSLPKKRFVHKCAFRYLCDVCLEPLIVDWTQVRGIGECKTCGTPYVMFHFTNDGRRVKKMPIPVPGDYGCKMAKWLWDNEQSNYFRGVVNFINNSVPHSTYQTWSTRHVFEHMRAVVKRQIEVSLIENQR